MDWVIHSFVHPSFVYLYLFGCLHVGSGNYLFILSKDCKESGCKGGKTYVKSSLRRCLILPLFIFNITLVSKMWIFIYIFSNVPTGYPRCQIFFNNEIKSSLKKKIKEKGVHYWAPGNSRRRRTEEVEEWLHLCQMCCYTFTPVWFRNLCRDQLHLLILTESVFQDCTAQCSWFRRQGGSIIISLLLLLTQLHGIWFEPIPSV